MKRFIIWLFGELIIILLMIGLLSAYPYTLAMTTAVAAFMWTFLVCNY